MSGYGDMVKGAFASKSGVKTRKKKVEVSDLVLTEEEEAQLSANIDDHLSWVNEGEAKIAELGSELAASHKANYNINLILDEAIARNETLQKQLKSHKMHYAKLKNRSNQRLGNMHNVNKALTLRSDLMLQSLIGVGLFAVLEFVVIMLS